MSFFKNILKSEPVKLLICKLVFLYIKFILITSKFEIIYDGFDFSEYENKQSIFATWHGRVIIMPIINPSKVASCAIVSDHNDGRLIGGVIKQAGISLIYGSSNRRRISALKEIMVAISKGLNFLVTPDGPRGPARKVDGAIINIASTTGLPIMPSSYSAKYLKSFNSWDSFILPLPFNKITAVFTKPIIVPKNITLEEKENYKEMLRKSLDHAMTLADNYIKM